MHPNNNLCFLVILILWEKHRGRHTLFSIFFRNPFVDKLIPDVCSYFSFKLITAFSIGFHPPMYFIDFSHNAIRYRKNKRILRYAFGGNSPCRPSCFIPMIFLWILFTNFFYFPILNFSLMTTFNYKVYPLNTNVYDSAFSF